jgi:hypothetical protein
MDHLVVGWGEVGQAIGKILQMCLRYSRKSSAIDLAEILTFPVKVIHICIPYDKEFKKTVKYWQNEYPKALVIVHSSVPVGTCDALGVVHSPIRGVHPHLEDGIRTFVKYFGGKKAWKAAKIFRDLDIETKVYKDARTTEAIKLWDTTQYGKLIMLEKEIHAWCQKNKIDFKAVYQDANRDYNEGYRALGRDEVVRPYLKHIEGPIGGHCVLPNLKLLKVKL